MIRRAARPDRTMPWVGGLAGSLRPAELLPRGSRWAAFSLLALFTLLGSVQHARGMPAAVVAAVITVGAGALTFEPRRPPLLACAALATGAVIVLCAGVPSNVGWFAVCVLCGWCVLAAGRTVGLVYWVVTMTLFAIEWLWVEPDPGWGAWMAGTTFTALLALLVRHELDLVAKLRAAQAGLAESARAEERNRIARDLHDVIAHTLIVSQLHVASARLAVQSDPTDAARALAEAERLGRESLAEVRRAVGLLRQDGDAGNGVAPPLPGAADLPALVERFYSAGADVTLTVDGDTAAVPATTGLALYRIVQEALTNAVKHARGSSVTVEVTVESAQVDLLVESGGPPGHGGGLGLLSMGERASSLGGTFEAGPGGRGWLVRAVLPSGLSSGRAT